MIKFNLRVAVIIILFTSGCTTHKLTESNRFPGFTLIGDKQGKRSVFVDLKSIKYSSAGKVTFSLLQVLDDGYVIQNVITDGNKLFQRLDGVKYSLNGSVIGKYADASAHNPNLISIEELLSEIRPQVDSALKGFSPYPPMVYPVRIGIATRAPLSYILTWEPAIVFVDEKPVFDLCAQHLYKITKGRIEDSTNGESFVLPRDRRAYVASSRYRVWANNCWYGGTLELISFGNRVTIINLLDLENYLCGVVPVNIPNNYHLEATKTLAVAARSYAYAHMGTAASKWYRTEGYDLVSDARDQIYKGQAVATDSTNVAVWLTRGIILKDAGRVKSVRYCAYITDPYEDLNIRQSSVESKLLEKITDVPNVVSVTVNQWDQNGNARGINIVGSKKTREIYGVALAKMLHFSTAGILEAKKDKNNWIFTLRGPGNGSRGLSKHGANIFAAKGWLFEQILQQYYQDSDGNLKLDYMDRYKVSGQK